MLAATPSVYKPKVLKAFRFGGHGVAFGATTSTGLGIKYVGDNGFASSVTVNSQGGDDAAGFLTKEDASKVNIQAAYTKENYHVSATYTTQTAGWDEWVYFSTSNVDSDADLDTDGWALRGWWRPDETGTIVPSVSVGFDTMTMTNTTRYTDASGYSIGLNWSDTFQAGDTIGVALGQPIKGTEKVNSTVADDVDPFIWEAYYSFRPNDSIEITPGIFGGSDSRADKNDDIFGAVITSTFKF